MNSDFIRTQYETNSVVTIETKYDTIKKLVIRFQGNYQLILIYIRINEISYERSDCSIIRKFHYPLSQIICKIVFAVDLTLKIQ